MKVSCLALLTLFAASPACSAAAAKGDKTITKVVKLLQEMMQKSKEEGDTEKSLYGKFKCYCDTNDAEKVEQIDTLSKTLGLLESAIDNVQATNGELSAQTAQFKSDMEDNAQARKDATNLRDKENTAFKAEEQDLKQAVSQMGEAIKLLSAIGGDQTLGKSASLRQGSVARSKTKPLLIALSVEAKNALAAASIFLSAEQRKHIGSFLQAPFTGAYSSQSGQIVGILKEMKSTFSTNLAEALATETKAKESYDAFMSTKKDAYSDMEATYNEKQGSLSSNDGALTSKKKQLQVATKDKAEAEEFLTMLTDMCAKKAKEYDDRKLSRANEQAAVAQAISILNSDSAFETFGSVSATSTGQTAASFLQLNRGRATALQSQLERVLRVEKSSRLMRVLAVVEAGNPFSKVLVEIQKMKELSVAEGKEDKRNLDWCMAETTDNRKNLKDREADILSLTGDIDKLSTTVKDPVKGLTSQIQGSETSLVQNNDAQSSETKQRLEENIAYQADVRNLVDADDLLSKAIVVLSKYYEELQKRFDGASASMVQEEPTPPSTWGKEQGQSSKGGDAISMLKFILSETKKEEFKAHTDEEKAQAAFEDSMADLKNEQSKLQEAIVKLSEDLATAEKSLVEKKEDLKDATDSQAKIEDYLSKIKPGCDFIAMNFDLRESSRKTETQALDKAVKLIKETPAYKAAAR